MKHVLNTPAPASDSALIGKRDVVSSSSTIQTACFGVFSKRKFHQPQKATVFGSVKYAFVFAHLRNGYYESSNEAEKSQIENRKKRKMLLQIHR